MNETTLLPNRIAEIFKPTPRGIVGLVDDLFRVCSADGFEMEWREERCRIRIGAEKSDFMEVPLPKSAFRALLARIAALCNERRANSVTPYGGKGELIVAQDRSSLFIAAFVNTPSEQRLALTPVPFNSSEAGQL